MTKAIIMGRMMKVLLGSVYLFCKPCFIIINLIYIAQYDTYGILTALYIVIMCIHMQYVHI